MELLIIIMLMCAGINFAIAKERNAAAVKWAIIGFIFSLLGVVLCIVFTKRYEVK